MEGTIMKRILPVIFMLITSITVFAQEDTRMLKEGRSWKVLEMFCDQPEYETYTVSGDTVINGKTWKKILVDYQKTTIRRVTLPQLMRKTESSMAYGATTRS